MLARTWLGNVRTGISTPVTPVSSLRPGPAARGGADSIGAITSRPTRSRPVRPSASLRRGPRPFAVRRAVRPARGGGARRDIQPRL